MPKDRHYYLFQCPKPFTLKLKFRIMLGCWKMEELPIFKLYLENHSWIHFSIDDLKGASQFPGVCSRGQETTMMTCQNNSGLPNP